MVVVIILFIDYLCDISRKSQFNRVIRWIESENEKIIYKPWSSEDHIYLILNIN